jgi:hypothetical protein
MGVAVTWDSGAGEVARAFHAEAGGWNIHEGCLRVLVTRANETGEQVVDGVAVYGPGFWRAAEFAEG